MSHYLALKVKSYILTCKEKILLSITKLSNVLSMFLTFEPLKRYVLTYFLLTKKKWVNKLNNFTDSIGFTRDLSLVYSNWHYSLTLSFWNESTFVFTHFWVIVHSIFSNNHCQWGSEWNLACFFHYCCNHEIFRVRPRLVFRLSLFYIWSIDGV